MLYNTTRNIEHVVRTYSRRKAVKSIIAIASVVVCCVGLVAFNPAPLAAQLVPVSKEATLPNNYPLVTKPLQCLAAVTREVRLIWRKNERDTMQLSSPHDTLPTQVVHRAKQCASQFSLTKLVAGQDVPGLTSRDIFPLLRLYLVVGWDDSVRVAAESLVANSSMTASDSTMHLDVVLRRIVDAYLAARPLRLFDAQRYAEQIDSLGVPFAVSRLRVHAKLAEQFYNVGDSANVVRHTRAALAAASDIPGKDRGLEFVPIRTAYFAALDAADVLKDSELAEEVMKSFNQLMKSLPTSEPELPDSVLTYLSSQLPILENWLNVGYTSAIGITGEIPPVVAEHWFAEDGKAISSIDPTAPTLVLRINPHRCNGIYCDRAYAALSRLAKEFQPRGVQVVLLVSTIGYLHLDVFDKVADEVQAIRVYVQDTLKLPGVLAISESSFFTKADGRIQQVPNGNESYGANWFVLRDGAGNSHTKAFGFLSDRQESEVWVKRALERMLERAKVTSR